MTATKKMTRAEAAAKARAVKAALLPPLEQRFWSKVDKRGPNECWPWLAAVRRKDEGYGAFSIEGRHRPAHRVAWELTTGESIPAGMVACHKCDNPRCCNPGHLFIGTPQDNDADRVAKGRQAHGERNGFSVLTERQVFALRVFKRTGFMKVSEAARLMGVNQSTAYDAVTRRWRHLDERRIAAELKAQWGRT